MTTGVVLMTYGSARNADEVAGYLSRIRGGRPAPDELVTEFQARYEKIGGSPLVPITQQVAAALEERLGSDFHVRAGMRFSEPFLGSVVRELASLGVERVLGVIMSPQYSPIIMGGYARVLSEECRDAGISSRLAGAWHLEESFVEVMATRVRRGLEQFDEPSEVQVLMSAHSLPKRVVDTEPVYIEQLQDSATAIAAAAGLSPNCWCFGYQSAGHTPEEWLKPDLVELLPKLAAEGHTSVLVAPVQFLADHLETLYDVDVAGLEQADEAGIVNYARMPAPNADPDFIQALAHVVRREMSGWGVPLPATVGVA